MDGHTTTFGDRVRPSSRAAEINSATPDGESIMLGLYEWVHEVIAEENAARRQESSEGN